MNGTIPADDAFPAEFVGERVLLRPFSPDDAAALLDVYDEIRAQPPRPFENTEEIHTLTDALSAIDGRMTYWNKREDLAVGIFDRATGRLLGESGLGAWWDERKFELGFWLRPSAVGHGYMTEANILICEWVFKDLDARLVCMSCDARNTRSVAVARRLGLRQLEPQYLEKESRTLLSFEMTADEYVNAPWRAKG